MNKKALTEADIRTKFITPALVGPNGDKWDLMAQIREEAYFTKGRVMVRGKTVHRFHRPQQFFDHATLGLRLPSLASLDAPQVHPSAVHLYESRKRRA